MWMIILAAPSERVDDILGTFNSLHIKLQFILKVCTNERISFLDTLLIVEQGDLYLTDTAKQFSLADSSILIHIILFVIRKVSSINL